MILGVIYRIYLPTQKTLDIAPCGMGHESDVELQPIEISVPVFKMKFNTYRML